MTGKTGMYIYLFLVFTDIMLKKSITFFTFILVFIHES